MIRSLILISLTSLVMPLAGQSIQGRVSATGSAGEWLVLHATRGSDHHPIDSVRIAHDGTYRFPHRPEAAGFYQLSIHDTDRVDIIISPADGDMELDLDGLPLQRHVRVVRSAENQRLWAYKSLSRELQAVQATATKELQHITPTDTVRMNEVNAVVRRAEDVKNDYLERVRQEAPTSYFALVVGADKALDGVVRKGPMDVAAVFDFSDPRLLRSAVYDRAIMTFLMNINAVSEDQFLVGSDTLMALAARDIECSAYMMEHLLDLFSVYGPQRAVHHILDRYVVPRGATGDLPAGLRSKVEDLLKVAVGAIGYDVNLNDHGTRIPLSRLCAKARYTVLFFYSSTCEHCHAQMPVLKEMYNSIARTDLGIIGVALDADSAEFKQCIADEGIPWPSFSEFNGWGSVAAKVYQVKATPMLFVLDRERRIVMKPVDAADLAGQWKELP